MEKRQPIYTSISPFPIDDSCDDGVDGPRCGDCGYPITACSCPCEQGRLDALEL